VSDKAPRESGAQFAAIDIRQADCGCCYRIEISGVLTPKIPAPNMLALASGICQAVAGTIFGGRVVTVTEIGPRGKGKAN
jgi:hypothetical protein